MVTTCPFSKAIPVSVLCLLYTSAFPSGDPFVVYPGDDYQPVASLRFEIMRAVMQDIRALRLLESTIGREQTLSLLEDAGEITFNTYPTSAKWLLDKREQINQLIINAE